MQIAYFPYLNLSGIEEISFGDIKIWNFDRKASEYIPDEALRTKVKALLDSNVKDYGGTVCQDSFPAKIR